MRRVASSAMILGDLLVLSISSLFLVFRSSYSPWLPFDLSLSLIPYLVSWFGLAFTKHAYDLDQSKRDFIRRNISLWWVSMLLAEAIRFILKLLVTSTILSFLGIVVEIIEMSFVFLTWKFGSYAIYRISSQPNNRIAKRLILVGTCASLILAVLVISPFLYSVIKYSKDIYSVEKTPYADAALVLGAGVWFDGTPSITLINRVESAIDLYRTGRTRYIVLSGSQQETKAMRQLVLGSGIRNDSLLLDLNGVSTLDSCINLLKDHAYSNVIVVSQKYHLYRALYICNSVGIDSIGVFTDSGSELPETILRRYLREIGATVLDNIEILAKKLWGSI